MVLSGQQDGSGYYKREPVVGRYWKVVRRQRVMGYDGKRKENRIKQAIALEYSPQEDAPKVIASGKGILAEKIIERAKESDVPIHRDDKLADTLSRLDIGEAIPPELYQVVAEILVFVDAMDKLRGKMGT